jgi:hypothetical protein
MIEREDDMKNLRISIIGLTLAFFMVLPAYSGDIVNTIELQAGQGKSIQPHCLANTMVTVTFTNISTASSAVRVESGSAEEINLNGSGASQTRSYPCEVGSIGVQCTTGNISVTVSIPTGRR